MPVSCTSNIPQICIGDYSGFYIRCNACIIFTSNIPQSDVGEDVIGILFRLTEQGFCPRDLKMMLVTISAAVLFGDI